MLQIMSFASGTHNNKRAARLSKQRTRVRPRRRRSPARLPLSGSAAQPILHAVKAGAAVAASPPKTERTSSTHRAQPAATARQQFQLLSRGGPADSPLSSVKGWLRQGLTRAARQHGDSQTRPRSVALFRRRRHRAASTRQGESPLRSSPPPPTPASPLGGTARLRLVGASPQMRRPCANGSP